LTQILPRLFVLFDELIIIEIDLGIRGEMDRQFRHFLKADKIKRGLL